jgi:hypothetical protein
VAGSGEVDLGVLRAHTQYAGGYSAGSATVAHFWAVLASWGAPARSAYLRFVWGRARLPVGEHWPRDSRARGPQMHVLSMLGAPGSADGATARLPEAHTCFFTLDLPPYPTLQLTRDKLERAVQELTMQVV